MLDGMKKRFSVAIFVAGFLVATIFLLFLFLRYLPINIATYFNLLALVRTQAYLGADLNSTWIFDETPLMIASNKPRQRIFEFLVDAGADINKRTYRFYGETVLHRASRDGCFECVNLLIERNVDVNQRDSVGRTAVLFAGDQVVIVGRLLDAGADPDEPDFYSGLTPLMEATRYKNTPMIKLLLDHGASPDKSSLKGDTAISIAEKNGDKDIIELLKQYSSRR